MRESMAGAFMFAVGVLFWGLIYYVDIHPMLDLIFAVIGIILIGTALMPFLSMLAARSDW